MIEPGGLKVQKKGEEDEDLWADWDYPLLNAGS